MSLFVVSRHLRKLVAQPILAFVLVTIPVHSQGWTDRAEYDLVLDLRSEASPEKKLAFLEQWKDKYPKSQLKQLRSELELSICQGLADWPRVLKIAGEMVKDDPGNYVGLYWLTILAPSMSDPSPEMLSQSETAARSLLTGMDSFLAREKIASGSPESKKRRTEIEVLAHRTLGWVQWQRKAYDAAEREFHLCLAKDPRQSEISAWLGTVLVLSKQPAKQAQAIWHLTRASYLEGEGALAAGKRHEVRSLLDAVYVSYRGSAEGLNELGTAAKSAAMPPSDLRIETAAEATVRKQDEELSRSNPELAAWVKIRRRLESADGDTYFQTLTGSPLPKLKAFVVRCVPPTRPKEIGIAFQDPAVQDAILKLDTPLPNGADAGTPIEFDGSAVSFSRDPFTMTIAVPRSQLVGWPARR